MNAPWSRRSFIQASTLLLLGAGQARRMVMTVNGPVAAKAMGTTLIHEHLLVDFIGADQISPDRWQADQVVAKVLPYLLEAKKAGVRTFMDCTPAFLGRDVRLQKRLADATGLHILTNTGYYGAVGNKFLPKWAFIEAPEQLAAHWVAEFEQGIEGTGIRPGFIKTSVEPGPLSPLHQNLVRAAGLTHLRTGLTICSHTGPGLPALEQIELLRQMGVHASAFVWTHAQGERDRSLHAKAAQLGAWISLDGLGWSQNFGQDRFEVYADSIANLRAVGRLDRVLISHDAGWYKPGEPDGGNFMGYTNIFTELLPMLRQRKFSEREIRQLLVRNPAEAFALRVRPR
jgi:phosphotriesterase-related protein